VLVLQVAVVGPGQATLDEAAAARRTLALAGGS